MIHDMITEQDIYHYSHIDENLDEPWYILSVDNITIKYSNYSTYEIISFDLKRRITFYAL